MPTVDANWEEWLATNVTRGCSADSMTDAMVRAGFEPAVADSAVRRAVGGAVADGGAATTGSAQYRYDPAPVSAGNLVHAFDRDVSVLMRCERPQIVIFGDVLSAAECDELVERSRHRLKRNTTINPETGAEDVIRNRTSEGTWFPRGEDAFIERLDRRIACLMNWPVENGEGLQILHYGPGAEYRPHFDYFPPEQSGSAVQLAHGGQRVATLVIYLNDVPEGGETVFPDAGISVTGRKGTAVYFRYMNGMRQLDPLSLHAGAPVRRGEKWIATRWMREHAYR
ncbi:prolyl 4-hydroxylase [Paraburkholderia caballeronis]|uniref:2OG-Fe(II) oxygenase n=1 Tax=Paraburkholderia caballeronis TaxID=416943 RepID=UPI001066C8FA|nr:2OG-Fe(II) oxygenase [Paraburkholderia caballeronis]TDV28445.1 prolyl 4-hydroxylase [Paraburkholderia caballeronis]